MKFLALVVVLFAVLAVSGASYRRPYPKPRYPVFPQYPNRGDEYAASLGGAPIGFYGKSSEYGSNRGSLYGGSEVRGISLGNAKVGLYGNDRQNRNFPLYG